MQEFTDDANGENVLIVSHMDAVNASVTRYKPWALVYPVQHTGFTASYREKYDGACAVLRSNAVGLTGGPCASVHSVRSCAARPFAPTG
jgi:hypothetical protein